MIYIDYWDYKIGGKTFIFSLPNIVLKVNTKLWIETFSVKKEVS